MTTQPRLKSTFQAQNGGFWAWFGLQFGAKSSIIDGVDANLSNSFLTVKNQNCILIFRPWRAKLLSEIGVSVAVNRRGFFISQI